MLWKKQKLRGQPKDLSNIWFSLFTTLLTTSLALIMIPYESFVTNVTDIFTFPYERLYKLELNPERSLSELLEDTHPLGQCRESIPENPKLKDVSSKISDPGATEVLYLFLLDVSGSTKSKEIPTPPWLLDTIDRIQSYMRDDIFDSIKRKNKVTVFDLAKVRLGDLLIRIDPKNTSSELSREKFALWSLGTHPKPLFPLAGEKEIPIKKDTIRDALNTLKKPTNEDKNTDFVAVIQEFEDNYPDYLPQNPGLAAKGRVAVITILSDFIHDAPNRKSKIDEDWSALEERIRYHSHANVVANLIVLTESGQVEKPRLPTHRQITRPYEKHFPLGKFSINAIANDVRNHLLYPLMCSRQPIEFYYEGQRFISDFTLHIDEKVKQKNKHFDLTIAIPEKANQPPVSLRWSLLTAEGHKTDKRDIEEIGWVGSKGEIFSKSELKLNDRVHLAPLNHPSQLADRTVSAQFISSALRRVHHVDIQFIKVMPAWYARIIIVFHVILAVLSLVLSVQGIRILINKWRERKERVVVSDKGPTKIKFKDLGGVWESTVDWLTFKPGRHYVRSPLDRSRPMERGSYQIMPHDSKTLLRFFGSLEGPVHNPSVPVDWEIVHWDKHKLDLMQPSGQVIHYKRHTGPEAGSGIALPR